MAKINSNEILKLRRLECRWGLKVDRGGVALAGGSRAKSNYNAQGPLLTSFFAVMQCKWQLTKTKVSSSSPPPPWSPPPTPWILKNIILQATTMILVFAILGSCFALLPLGT